MNASALAAALVNSAADYQEEHEVLLALLAVPVMALWVLAFVPSTPLELALGFIFGVRTGYLVVLCGKVLGCGISFVLARTVAFSWARQLPDTRAPRVPTPARARAGGRRSDPSGRIHFFDRSTRQCGALRGARASRCAWR